MYVLFSLLTLQSLWFLQVFTCSLRQASLSLSKRKPLISNQTQLCLGPLVAFHRILRASPPLINPLPRLLVLIFSSFSALLPDHSFSDPTFFFPFSLPPWCCPTVWPTTFAAIFSWLCWSLPLLRPFSCLGAESMNLGWFLWLLVGWIPSYDLIFRLEPLFWMESWWCRLIWTDSGGSPCLVCGSGGSHISGKVTNGDESIGWRWADGWISFSD